MNLLGFIVLNTVALGALVFINYYIPRRLVYHFNFENVKMVYIVFIALFLSSGFVGQLLVNSSSFVGKWMHIMLSTALGVIVYLFLFLLLVHAVSLFVKLPPMNTGIMVVLLTTLVSAWGIWNALSYSVYQNDISIEGLKNEIKIAHITDTHLGHFKGRASLEKIVNNINRENPDLVLITGDLVESRAAIEDDIISPLKMLEAPVYFTDGNHDAYADRAKTIELVKKYGVKVLENEKVEFAGVQLVGINYMKGDEDTFDMHANGHKTVKEVLSEIEIDPKKPSILMHHSPDGVEYASQKGFDLMLSGHTHAGQIFPINLIAGLIFPYNKGLHNHKGTMIYVSQGLGTFGTPMRVGTDNELALINLKPE